jgi:hypothetical protein
MILQWKNVMETPMFSPFPKTHNIVEIIDESARHVETTNSSEKTH